jgi:hypothetical protein
MKTITITKAESVIETLKENDYTNAKYDENLGKVNYFYMGDKENYSGFAHVMFSNYTNQFYLTVEHNRIDQKDMSNFLKELHDSMFLVNVLNNILNS